MKKVMTVKIFKPAMLVLMALASLNSAGFSQDAPKKEQPEAQKKPDEFDGQDFQQKLGDLNLNLNFNLKNLVNNIVVKINDLAPKLDLALSGYKNEFDFDIAPKLGVALNNLAANLDLNIDAKTDFNINEAANDSLDNIAEAQQNDEGASLNDKFKSYSKSYPIDGNDKIKLSNQYGKITVNTWNRPEVKVDVQIKAQAEDDGTAQKLLDGVQIRDGKEGDVVYFKTSIEPNNNRSWKIWNWGNKKNHKIEINYTVYMPAKTDLNVEDSYGAIQLPDLNGRVRISSSYGSVSAENLSNPSNTIEGSYGSLKIGTLNGARLDFSYGNAEIDECNNLKGDLSYGSFKLGKLKGAADFNLSFVTRFKIEEMGNSFKKLDVNSSYSGVSLAVPTGNNFDFDITTTYGGFNYNSDKVIVTSKTPADESKHYSSTKNYKGHYGKEGSESQVVIRSTYGSVNFE